MNSGDKQNVVAPMVCCGPAVCSVALSWNPSKICFSMIDKQNTASRLRQQSYSLQATFYSCHGFHWSVFNFHCPCESCILIYNFHLISSENMAHLKIFFSLLSPELQ